jgi:hypothetical protein
MITYALLARYPTLCSRAIGMDLSTFDRFYAEFEAAYYRIKSQSMSTIRGHKRRRRRAGGGRRHTLDLRTRLLIYLFWGHARPTQSLLGKMYGLSRGTVAAIISDIHYTYTSLAACNATISRFNVRQLRTLNVVVDAFPELKLDGGTMP